MVVSRRSEDVSLQIYSKTTLSTALIKTEGKKVQILIRKISKNTEHHWKVVTNVFHLNSHTFGAN